MEKIYINDDNTATFVCPKCQKTGYKDLTKYLEKNKKLSKLKAKCSCSHTYIALLEKRKKFRKATNLPGKYLNYIENSTTPDYTGSMTVKDLSYSGLRIKLQMMPRFKVGDTLHIEFHLDDNNQSAIKKRVVVKNMKGLSAGLEYFSPQNHDSVLGFYLFN